ncbi:molybdopterin dehydrogenase, FAD-binding [Rhizorhabdus wittichii RW1]|uniref:Molybdopterin dehydrogenase, FAD-binding n=1 Tax=Rhizorhabdus wittichii (strain DSM 6014 / CCUG 31198 / JCM 15750 / NBRC 105917 / EY 4224 / RW1) TaxID=392499 RepID=A0A9J9H8F4_RHIWR|nr:molybdopterin dehydrogenase, FAD-binding [Rhizorhabdus wittichii RW1]
MDDPVPVLAAPDYFLPTTIAEVGDLLIHYDGRARLLAGGQTLIPELDRPGGAPDALIDLRRIAELGRIEWRADHVEIGAMVTIAAARAELARAFPVVAACLGHVANSAVRNRATLGGSLALADPASEISTFLLAYDAEVMLAGGEARPVDRLITGQAREPAFIRAIRLPFPAEREHVGFAEILRRRSGGRSLAMALARLDAGRARLTVSGGTCQPFRIEATDGPALLETLAARSPAFDAPSTRSWALAAARRAIATAEDAAC